MKIRSAKIEDLKRISYITRIAWGKPYKKDGVINSFHEVPNFAEQFTDKKLFILVAILNDKIIGALRYEFRNKAEIYFSKLVTLPSARGQGVGSSLIKKLESLAKRRKIKKISLDCMEEKLLIPFYQKLGYKIVKKVKHLDHHDVYFSKKIR